jgi:hypothetical protein
MQRLSVIGARVLLVVVAASVGGAYLARSASPLHEPDKTQPVGPLKPNPTDPLATWPDGQPVVDIMNPIVWYSRDGQPHTIPSPPTPAELKAKAEADRKWREYEAKAAALRNPTAGLTLGDKFNWYLGGFDVVAIATFTVKSTNSFPTKDIEFTCTTYGASGTPLSKVAHTVYDVVPPKSSKVLREVNLGFVSSQSTRMSCSITSAVAQ